VTALLLLVLSALQEPPAIVDISTLTDGCARSGCWLPLKVALRGPAGFEGEVTASADAGFRVTRPFRLPASGTAGVILPVVVLAPDAKVEVVLRGPSGTIGSRNLQVPLKFLKRERLVLVDPRHPEAEAYRGQDLEMPDKTPVRFAISDPSDWNEAADMGALECVDAVVASDDRAVELTMMVWRALGGALVTQPRRDLFDRLREPAARFPAIDETIARFTLDETWIPRKRDSALLFVVIYGFAFFVAVYVTWSRKGGPAMLMGAAIGAAILFVGAYSAFFPKEGVAVRAWQGIVDAPEAPVAISVCAIWGTGRIDTIGFGRIVKPVHATARETALRDLELRWSDGAWSVRGASPGDSTRFVCAERLASIEPHKPFGSFKARETDYYQRVPRKKKIALQDPATAAPVPVRSKGLIESSPARVFRIEVNK
jgi:hypothetical protein